MTAVGMRRAGGGELVRAWLLTVTDGGGGGRLSNEPGVRPGPEEVEE
jgi:hypothetical protein